MNSGGDRNHSLNYNLGHNTSPTSFLGGPVEQTQNEQTSPRSNSFVMSNPPLAALHNMADGMKASTSGSVFSQSPAFISGQAGAFNPLKSFTASGSGASTPHNISDILRASMAGSLNPLGLSSINPNMHSMYLNSSGRFPKPIADLPGRSPIYWPGSMLNSPWRANQGMFSSSFPRYHECLP